MTAPNSSAKIPVTFETKPMPTTPQQPERAGTGGHTAGPWTIGGRNNSIVFDEKGQAVSNTLFVPGRTDEEKRRANARLIAAAPDLLAALTAALSHIEDNDEFSPTSVYRRITDQCRAAILRATSP